MNKHIQEVINLAVPEGNGRCISGKKSINVPASRLIGKSNCIVIIKYTFY